MTNLKQAGIKGIKECLNPKKKRYENRLLIGQNLQLNMIFQTAGRPFEKSWLT